MFRGFLKETLTKRKKNLKSEQFKKKSSQKCKIALFIQLLTKLQCKQKIKYIFICV